MIINYGTGGGSSGGTLIVTAPSGVSITVKNNALGKIYRRTANGEGKAVFKGLAGGDWLLSMTDGEKTTEPVTVTIKSDYEKTLAFFSAEIVVTYPADSVCTCEQGDYIMVDENTSSGTTKTVTFVVPNDGKWTITAKSRSDSTKEKSKDIEISREGQRVTETITYRYYIFERGKGFVNGHSAKIWNYSGNSAASTNATGTNYIDIGRNYANYELLEVQQAIGLKDYKTVNMTLKQTSGDKGAVFGVVSKLSNNINLYGGLSDSLDTEQGDTRNINKEVTLSINVTDTMKQSNRYLAANFAGCICQVYDIYLE